MSKTYVTITDKLATFMLAQPIYFIGTAPLDADGHVNISPKGMGGTFAVLGPTTVGYLDYTGSGIETIAHLNENGRIVVMFCAFDGPPNIVRLHGRGHPVLVGDPAFEELRSRFGKQDRAGERSVIVVELDRIADSCGFSVPLMKYRADRDVLDRSHRRRPDGYFDEYWVTRNAASIDGLPGLR